MLGTSTTRALLGMAALASLAPCVSAQTFTSVRVTGQMLEPTALAAPTGETDRIFVTSKKGTVKLFKSSTGNVTEFLDIKDDVFTGNESGLLGIAFHPDYANNGKFYLSWTTNDSINGDSVISQFNVSATDPDLGDPLSRVDIWGPLPQVHTGHKSGDIEFGPDGLLYFALGDGGTSFDPFHNAQNLLDPRGSILRFDVDLPFPHIPPTNPFVGDPNALDEIYHYGVRNPYRLGIDDLTGDIWIGDVGQSDREEINFAPAGVAPINFGWRCYEGEICTEKPGCPDCATPGFTEPVHAYNHDFGFGCAVIGGTVYRGDAIPAMQGRYIFAEHCTDHVWSFELVGGVKTDFREHTEELFPDDGTSLNSCSGIGYDGVGELYLLDFFGDEIFKIVPVIGFKPLSGALAGTNGEPVLAGSGDLIGGQDVTLSLSSALANSAATLVVGLDRADLPFKGGVIVPDPALFVPGLPTDGAGTLDLVGLWPVGLPPEFQLYLQFWVVDPGAPKGLSASNALLAVTAP